ncbi:unnamed protein product, partial [Cyprideis torosa]
MKVAVVGATGMVGRVMLQVLEERKFPVTELIPVASAKSAGSKIVFAGNEYTVLTMEQAVALRPNVALFSAGGDTSKQWAPKFADVGCKVIDNSSAWRMEPYIKLVVPEVNGDVLEAKDMIIANPNCSTIQLVAVLHPLNKAYHISRVVVSTYQSISGTGVKAVRQMELERKDEKGEMAYPYAIDKNCLPHCDSFTDNGYTKEEMKLTNESKKILGDDSVQVVATAVRVPVDGGHSESVNITVNKPFNLGDVRRLLHETEGVVVQDNPEMNIYPMPLFAKGKDEVFVGRIREDFTMPNTLNMWIVSDNLRKGAATNTIQIAEYLLEKGIMLSCTAQEQNTQKVNQEEMESTNIENTETAVFASGCFWGTEYYLQKADGVLSTTSGYTGGHVENPTYREVCNKTTGHYEAVEVVFDPAKISYEELAILFFETHDPEQKNGQGPDIGPQYRSAIFYENDNQKKTAEKLIGILEGKGYDIATAVLPAAKFWPAELYHQDYYDIK